MKSISIEHRILHFIPLALTIGRIFISPIFLLFYLKHQAMGIPFTALPYILLGLVALSEISDFLDGVLARRWNVVTDLGKILDPMADSITRISMLLTFTQGIIDLPVILIFVFLYRDSVISTLRTVCALKGIPLAARTSGKIKAILQGVSVFAILLLMIPYGAGHLSLEALRTISFNIVLVTAIYTVASGIEYLIANRKYILQTLF